MVDFKKRMAGKNVKKPIDPLFLYDTLDRAHDKGPLRPAQESVLKEWYLSHYSDRDIIIKLHTGQGKTLIGLLMLQSRLNDLREPVIYLCPNNYLIDQTCEQAKQFGIATCKAGAELPNDFLDGNKILVTSIQKLFNGLTKFGLHTKSIEINSILMDDAHACSDAIREACRIRIPLEEDTYHRLKSLFASELEQQGVGTFSEIENKERNSFLPVPYWAWFDRQGEIAKILSAGREQNSIKFTWPLLKDLLIYCKCVISGTAVEIEPHIAPLDAFGSYWEAKHRIFMSATVADDSFLVKGLQLTPSTILNPLTYSKESWSGEKMIILPSLIHEGLNREEIVKYFGSVNQKKQYGVVAFTPSFQRTIDWEAYGSLVATADTLADIIHNLREGKNERTVILANRYDGIDLPDDTCRILILDSKPYSEKLTDLYEESCRPDNEAILMRTIRTVEQGLGRSVRGEKDYSVIIITGADITSLLRNKHSRKFLSPQMSTQIEIGIEIAEMAKQELDSDELPINVFKTLLKQCLNRDDSWKAFYSQQMAGVEPSGANENILNIYNVELQAEKLYQRGDYCGATKQIQVFLDKDKIEGFEKGWYLQEMARYNYLANRAESQKLQVSAHNLNRLLLKPPLGVTVKKLTVISQKRMERIAEWIHKYEDYSQLDIALTDILSSLAFGVAADKFEQALDEISRALGFAGERPDKMWKAGPDNLWALEDLQYMLWECKNEVETSRSEINKRETEQMNSSSAWFEKNYKGMKVNRIMIHPTNKVSKSAAFTHDVEVMTDWELKKFVKCIREFFKAFETLNLKDLSIPHIQKLVNTYKLAVEDLLTSYTRKIKCVK
jgi:replicative superfamily II helicase